MQLLRPAYKRMADNHNAEIFAANTLLVVLGTSVLTARVYRCFLTILPSVGQFNTWQIVVNIACYAVYHERKMNANNHSETSIYLTKTFVRM